MKREHKSESQSYIDWLKSIGCVLYLPHLPQGWGGYNWYVGGYNSSNNGREVYIKENMVFNKVLDLQTIRKIQGYD